MQLFLLSLFFGFSLDFLSVTIDSAYRGAVFDLEIPSCFFLHTKLSIYFSLSWETKTGFLVIVLIGEPFKVECSGDINIFFEFKLIFCCYSFVSFV